MPKKHKYMSNKELKKRILNYINYWRPVLDLQNWTVKVNWKEKTDVANCLADPAYKTMVIRFNLRKIARDIDDLEELVLHELVHAPLWLISRGLEDRERDKTVRFIEENTTSTFTNALLYARFKGEHEFRSKKNSK